MNNIELMNSVLDPDKVPAWQNDFWTITQEELDRYTDAVRKQCYIQEQIAVNLATAAAIGREREKIAKHFDAMPGREMFGGTVAEEIWGLK